MLSVQPLAPFRSHFGGNHRCPESPRNWSSLDEANYEGVLFCPTFAHVGVGMKMLMATSLNCSPGLEISGTRPGSLGLAPWSTRVPGAAKLSGTACRCPSCHSIIYSRRQTICGICESPLPAGFLFSYAEAKAVESLLRCERRRHRAWMARG